MEIHHNSKECSLNNKSRESGIASAIPRPPATPYQLKHLKKELQRCLRGTLIDYKRLCDQHLPKHSIDGKVYDATSASALKNISEAIGNSPEDDLGDVKPYLKCLTY